MNPETETIPYLESKIAQHGIQWRNTGRAGPSWKIRIYDQTTSGKQLAVYERTTTLIRIEHGIGTIPGVKECKCPKSDPKAGLSHFRGASVCMSVETIGALSQMLDKYFSVDTAKTPEIRIPATVTELHSSPEKIKHERLLRLLLAPKKPKTTTVTVVEYIRNGDVISEVLERAAGVCESCNSPAPFIRASNLQPFLEVHHRIRLADNGDDTVENAIALCPNCHRKQHFG